MPEILVIADDFTGAAEIGGIAHLFGLSVSIMKEWSDLARHKEDVIIIDTNTTAETVTIASADAALIATWAGTEPVALFTAAQSAGTVYCIPITNLYNGLQNHTNKGTNRLF